LGETAFSPKFGDPPAEVGGYTVGVKGSHALTLRI